MKLIKYLLVVFCSLLLISVHAANGDFHGIKGENIKASSFKGKWVIINYWASWCDICLNEIPEFNRFYKNNKDKNILIYAVNYDHLVSDELAHAVSNAGIQYPVLVEDPASLWDLGYFDVVPVTFVINPQGKVAQKIVGPTNETVLMNIIRSSQGAG